MGKPTVKKNQYVSTNSEMKKLQTLFRSADGELRWPVALVSDTGMRIAKATELLRTDLETRCRIAHVDVRPHPWRRLKTIGSSLVIPLVCVAQ